MSNVIEHMIIRERRSIQNSIALAEQNVCKATAELDDARHCLATSREALAELHEHAQRNGIDLDATP